METKANHILIGAFILAMTVLGFGFVFWIENHGSGSSSARYHIDFTGPVTGLAPASNVLFNGLKVGRVDKIEIDSVDPRKTRALILIRKDTPVRRNSFARIISQGLSGYASVMISPGTPDAEVMVAAATGDIPIIKAAPGGGSLFEAAPEVLNNVNGVLRRLDELVASNEDLVRQTLKNVEGFTATLDQNKQKIAVFMDDASKAARRINEAAEKLNGFMTDNREGLDKTVASIAATSRNAESFSDMLVQKQMDIADTITNIKQVSEQFKTVSVKLEKTLDGISGFFADEDGGSMMVEIGAAATSFRSLAEKLDKSLGDSAEGMAAFAKDGLREFEILMREGRKMVRAMERVMNQLERNPQGLLFGNKQVREYKAN